MTERSAIGIPVTSTASSHEQQQRFVGERTLIDASANIHVALTYEPLDAAAHMARVRSPKAGAVVLFAGTWFHVVANDYLPMVAKVTKVISFWLLDLFW
jgi:hypothetical protein